ncbi:hypothetical protein L7F22_047328 [Adiantum nelumboides]|nr:hypothetical protein [Adiantum nelumboides]
MFRPSSRNGPQTPAEIPSLLSSGEDRAVSVISIDNGNDKGKENMEEAVAMPIKRVRRQKTDEMEASKSEKGHEGSSHVIGDKKRKSRSRRHIGVEDFPLGVESTPYDLISDVSKQGPKISWQQLLHLFPKMRRTWSKMVSTRRAKTKAVGSIIARGMKDIVPVIDAEIKSQRVSNVYVDGGAEICVMTEKLMHRLGLEVNEQISLQAKMANNVRVACVGKVNGMKVFAFGIAVSVDAYVIPTKGEGYPLILGRPWLMAMKARQDWETGSLELRPTQKVGGKQKKIVYDMKQGRQQDLDMETSMDEWSTSSCSSSEEDASSLEVMGIVLRDPEGEGAVLVKSPLYQGKEELHDLLYFLEHCEAPSGMSKSEHRWLAKKATRYNLVNDDLYCKGKDAVLRRVPSSQDIKGILFSCHEGVCGGHFAQEITSRKILQAGFMWPSLHRDVQHWCCTCEVCQKVGPRRLDHENQNPIKTYGPFERWGIDAIGSLPCTQSGKEYIIMGVEYMTRWAEARATKCITAKDVAFPSSIDPCFNMLPADVEALMKNQVTKGPSDSDKGTPRKGKSSTQESPMKIGRWTVPRVALSTQTKFCFTKEDFHTEYGLCLVGQDPKFLCADDFSDEEWLRVKEDFLKKRAFGLMGTFGMSNVFSTTFSASMADVATISNMKANAAEKLKEKQQCLEAIKFALDQSKTKRDEQVGLMRGAAKIIERLNKDMEELKLDKAGLVPNKEAMAKLETSIQIKKEALKDMGLDIEVHNLDNLSEEAAQLQTVVIGVYMLRCQHPYHPLCFVTACKSADQCLFHGCEEPLKDALKLLAPGEANMDEHVGTEKDPMKGIFGSPVDGIDNILRNILLFESHSQAGSSHNPKIDSMCGGCGDKNASQKQAGEDTSDQQKAKKRAEKRADVVGAQGDASKESAELPMKPEPAMNKDVEDAENSSDKPIEKNTTVNLSDEDADLLISDVCGEILGRRKKRSNTEVCATPKKKAKPASKPPEPIPRGKKSKEPSFTWKKTNLQAPNLKPPKPKSRKKLL